MGREEGLRRQEHTNRSQTKPAGEKTPSHLATPELGEGGTP